MLGAQKSNITVLVPVKDNVNRTRHFLRNTLHRDSSIQFLIADGSLGSANFNLLREQRHPRMKYLRYEPDTSLSTFLAKMADAANHIDTEYAMTMDPGDYLVERGVYQASNCLDLNLSASVCAGDILLTYEIFGNLTPALLVRSLKTLNGVDLTTGLKSLKDTYAYLWYGLHRASVFSESWSFISQQKFKHPVLEYAPVVTALARGSMVYSPTPLILRVAAKPSLKTRQPSDFNVISASELAYEMKRFAQICEKEYGTDPNLIFSAFSSNAADVLQELHGRGSGVELGKEMNLKGKIIRSLTSTPVVGSHLGYAFGLLSSLRRGDTGHRRNASLLVSPAKRMDGYG